MIALVATPAVARTRSLTITQFDRVRIEGTFIIEIVTGRGPSAQISGTEQAIERTSVQAQGQMLVIKAARNAWGGWQGENPGPATIRLTTAELRSIGSSGASTVRVDHMRGPTVNIAQDGSGALVVASVEADTLDIGMAGAGVLTITGQAAQAHAAIRGAGVFDASALAISDLRLTSDGSAVVKAAARRSANVVANGTGTVTISGRPACTVVSRGSGSVICGSSKTRL
ncbi:DUF2807 domain-containing protein [Sphingomonas sp.]|uniref:GIN domain-containing protein n=1 Tax=Sphingomonas sp. TaxID=28214 RepID=UPI0025FC4448|nr:DUF2807 domain-containing protein [Sphingomonas sp.]